MSLPDARPAETYAEVEDALLSRWPETKLEPSLDRIRAFTELLGDPQRSFRVVHLTGTNGKTQHQPDDRDAAARAGPAHRPLHQPAPGADERADQRRRRAPRRRGLRPRLQRRRAVHAPGRRRAGPPAQLLRDHRRDGLLGVRRRPGRRGRRRGRHGRRLGRDQRRRRRRRGRAAGGGRPRASTSATTPRPSRSRRPGSSSPAPSRSWPSRRRRSPPCCWSVQPRSAPPSPARAWSSASSPARPAVGGQMISLQGLRGTYDDVFLPLYGAHQAQNAAVALAAVEAFAGDRPARRGPGARRLRRGDLARPARDHPAQPHDRARRGAQPARRRGRGRGAGGLVHASARWSA